MSHRQGREAAQRRDMVIEALRRAGGSLPIRNGRIANGSEEVDAAPATIAGLVKAGRVETFTRDGQRYVRLKGADKAKRYTAEQAEDMRAAYGRDLRQDLPW